MSELAPPQGWYYVGPSGRFGRKPVPVRVARKDLVVYRLDSGALSAVSRYCCHMSSDLSLACVEKDRIRCQFHGWEFDPSGACVRIPGSDEIPAFAKLRSYPVAERNGSVFALASARESFPLPFFWGEDPSRFICSRPRRIRYEGAWQMIVANGFDVAHMATFHRRPLLREPVVSTPHPEARRIILNYRIQGDDLIDRALIRVFGDEAELDYTVWSGNLVLAAVKIGSLVNRMMMIIQPAEAGVAYADLFTWIPARGPLTSLALRPALELSATVSKRFFMKEARMCRGVLYRPERQGPHDRLVGDFMSWLQSLAASPHGTS
jgi:nitrite reductase/ring-hydroxylating ferredoxin subunit